MVIKEFTHDPKLLLFFVEIIKEITKFTTRFNFIRLFPEGFFRKNLYVE
jgi:hypothetical protein